jgi:hypothetical protein
MNVLSITAAYSVIAAVIQRASLEAPPADPATERA